ncbi:hypothetical protein [Romboutsia sp.]|nr:hypothetical protein [Romboutsia sp.]HSQ88124.1 hypothetical protein [Romboutsia sp.]
MITSILIFNSTEKVINLIMITHNNEITEMADVCVKVKYRIK